MADTGFVLAGTGSNNSGAGDRAWSNPGNITAADDSRATSALDEKDFPTTQYLRATNFGFSIPSGATIDGVEVRVQRSRSGGANIRDQTIQLLVGGSRTGSNKAATGTNWPTSDANADYGGTSDTWGTSLSAAQVNASDFGVDIRAQYSASGFETDATARVDAVWIRVTYTESATSRAYGYIID